MNYNRDQTIIALCTIGVIIFILMLLFNACTPVEQVQPQEEAIEFTLRQEKIEVPFLDPIYTVHYQIKVQGKYHVYIYPYDIHVTGVSTCVKSISTSSMKKGDVLDFQLITQTLDSIQSIKLD